MSLTDNVQLNKVVNRSLSGAATTQSPAVSVDSAVDWVAVAVNLTAITGGGNLTLSLQWSTDGGTTWYTPETADSFAAISAAKSTVARFLVKGRQFRFNEVLTGTSPTAAYTADIIRR